MKPKLKTFLKMTSIGIIGYFINSGVNYIFLNDITLSFIIEIPKLAYNLIFTCMWFIFLEQIEKLIKRFRKKSNKSDLIKYIGFIEKNKINKSDFSRYCPKCAEVGECGVGVYEDVCQSCGTKTILQKIK